MKQDEQPEIKVSGVKASAMESFESNEGIGVVGADKR
jgi:hypothetical protein